MSRKTPHIEEIVMEYYPHYTAIEIRAMKPYGQCPSVSAIRGCAVRLGVKSTKEKLERIREKRVASVKNMPAETRKRIGEHTRNIYRIERMRVCAGLPQKTRYRLAKLTKRAQMAKNNLTSRRKYVPTTVPDLLWYDENTRRSKDEGYYTKKYGLRFAPAEE